MPFAAPLALVGLAFVPLVLAFWMLKLRRTERTVSSTLLWQRFGEDLQANAPWQRLRRSFLLLLQLLLVILLAFLAGAALRGAAGDARPRPRRGRSTPRPAWRRPTWRRPAWRRRSRRRSTRCATCRRAAGSASWPPGRRPGSWPTRRPTWGASGRPSPGSRPTAATADMGEALALASALAARAGDAQVLVATDAAFTPAGGPEGRGAGHGPAGGARAEEPGHRRVRRAQRPDRGDSLGLHLGRQPRPRADDRARGAVGRRPAPGGAGPVPGPGQPRRRGDRRRAAGRPRPGGAPGGHRPAGPGRPGLGGRAARPAAADPARQRRRPVPGDGPQLPAERGALRRHAGGLRRGHEARAVRPRHLRRRPAGDAAAGPHPRDRPAAHEPARGPSRAPWRIRPWAGRRPTSRSCATST